MIQNFESIPVQTTGQGLYEITREVIQRRSDSAIRNGIVNLSILHTSASLIIQENADGDVLTDLYHYFSTLVPTGSGYRHRSEGADDMPAHIKSTLTNSNLVVSIKDGELVLGKWQGVFVFEHRNLPRERTVLCHILGE